MQMMQETGIQSLNQKDSMDYEMATQSNILAWEIHGRRSLVGYSHKVIKASDII